MRRGGFRGGFHRGGGVFFSPWYGYDFEQAPPQDKYVILDPSGKPISVVIGVPKVPAGYSFRRATPSESALNTPAGMSGMDDSGIF